MKLLILFFEFIKIGLFTFGGGYSAIPLIRDTVLNHGWLDEAMLSNILAISETTPGPIMVNMATYIGVMQAGFAGAAAATLGVILPSFVIILLISSMLEKWTTNRVVQAVLHGIKPCIMGMILATGVQMALQVLFPQTGVNVKSAVILVILSLAMLLYRRWKKQNMSPILLIVLSAVLGMMFF